MRMVDVYKPLKQKLLLTFLWHTGLVMPLPYPLERITYLMSTQTNTTIQLMDLTVRQVLMPQGKFRILEIPTNLVLMGATCTLPEQLIFKP